MPIYVQVADVKGTVTEKNYKDWISVDSCDFEVQREVTEGTGAAKNREWKSPVVNAINFAKKADDATGGLAKWACGEPSKGKVVIAMVRTGDSGAQAYLVYTLQACILSKYSFSADDNPEEKGTEEFSISFLEIEMKFTEFDEEGTAGGPVIFTYDLATGAKK
jgi:type VI secretion system secreted protein Hcp